MVDSLLLNELTRRQMLKRSVTVGMSVPIFTVLLTACAEEDDDDQPGAEAEGDSGETVDDGAVDDETVDDDVDDTPPDTDANGQRGGALEVAQVGEPPTLDIHQTTAALVSSIVWHIYEPLFTWDADLENVPELAETNDVSEDGLTNTVTLREGVQFHNGDVMTASDVVASIERWGRLGSLGETLMGVVDEIVELDDHTIEFHMTEPFGAFTSVLARQNNGCAIYPASIVEAADDDLINEYIGTGPYEFVEHAVDQYVQVERFDDYVGRDEEPSGYAGTKHQYLDEIFFRPVPDEAARIAGIRAGDFHYVASIVPDNLAELEGDPDVIAEILPPSAFGAFVLNTAEGLLADQTLRQAFQAALDHEPLLQAGYGEGFYRLDPSIMFEETTAWHTTVGEELYDRNDPDTARELLEEAGYDGTPLRLMSTQEYQYMFYFGQVAQQQLEDVGFVVEHEVFDWATLTERRNDPGVWDAFTNGLTFRPDPGLLIFIPGTEWPGWWASDRKVELAQQLLGESDLDARFEVWEQLQELFYEEVPIIKLGDGMDLNARTARLQGFDPVVQLGSYFWNMWLEE